MPDREESSENSTSPYPEVIHDLPVPALLLEGGCICEANDLFVALIGYAREELEDYAISDLDIICQKKNRLLFERLIEQHEEFRNVAMRLKASNDDTRHVVSSAGTVSSPKDSYLLVVFTEVTTQKYLQRTAVEEFARKHREMGEHLQEELIQTLTGLRLLGRALAEELAGYSSGPEAMVADFNQYLDRAALLTRQVREELLPVEVDVEGLSAALRRFAAEADDTYGIPCEFASDRKIHMTNHTAAMTCYYVVQQTVSYQARIGSEGTIEIGLFPHSDRLHLVVTDRDTSIDEERVKGLARILRLMRYALGLFGGELEVEQSPGEGVRVVCRIPDGS